MLVHQLVNLTEGLADITGNDLAGHQLANALVAYVTAKGLQTSHNVHGGNDSKNIFLHAHFSTVVALACEMVSEPAKCL